MGTNLNTSQGWSVIRLNGLCIILSMLLTGNAILNSKTGYEHVLGQQLDSRAIKIVSTPFFPLYATIPATPVIFAEHHSLLETSTDLWTTIDITLAAFDGSTISKRKRVCYCLRKDIVRTCTSGFFVGNHQSERTVTSPTSLEDCRLACNAPITSRIYISKTMYMTKEDKQPDCSWSIFSKSDETISKILEVYIVTAIVDKKTLLFKMNGDKVSCNIIDGACLPFSGRVYDIEGEEATEDCSQIKLDISTQERCYVHIPTKSAVKASIVCPTSSREFYLLKGSVETPCGLKANSVKTTSGEILIAPNFDFSKIPNNARYNSLTNRADHEDYSVHHLVAIQESLISSLLLQTRMLATAVQSSLALCPIIERYIDGPMVIKPLVGGVLGRPVKHIKEILIIPEIVASTLSVVSVDGVVVQKYFDPITRLVLDEPCGPVSKMIVVSVSHHHHYLVKNGSFEPVISRGLKESMQLATELGHSLADAIWNPQDLAIFSPIDPSQYIVSPMWEKVKYGLKIFALIVSSILFITLLCFILSLCGQAYVSSLPFRFLSVFRRRPRHTHDIPLQAHN